MRRLETRKDDSELVSTWAGIWHHEQGESSAVAFKNALEKPGRVREPQDQVN